MRYRFTSAALSELRDAALRYEAMQGGLGQVFLDEVEAAVQRILSSPQAWHPLSNRTRRCRTHRFPFGVIYQILTEDILIVSIMDLRRNSISWRHL